MTASIVACFAITTSWTGTLLERVVVSYWRRMPIALTMLYGATEMEYSLGCTQLYSRFCLKRGFLIMLLLLVASCRKHADLDFYYVKTSQNEQLFNSFRGFSCRGQGDHDQFFLIFSWI